LGPLGPLLATLAGVDRVTTTPDGLPAGRTAVRVSVLSLPHLAGARPEALPAAPYLAVPAERREAWRARVESLPAPASVLPGRCARATIMRTSRGSACSIATTCTVARRGRGDVRFAATGAAGDPCALAPAASASSTWAARSPTSATPQR